MTLKHFLTLVMVATLTSLGQISLKYGAESLAEGFNQFIPAALQNIWIITGLGLYAIAMIFWIQTIRVVPLNVAIPISGLTFVMIPFLSSLILGEEVSKSNFIGSGFIIMGIYLSYA
ncbi:EamA-like transporter family [Polynucleobacter duraquae]|uniref:EamA-like transporter family n=1 Tax=Polynucleobacter duraquae TaxID=1835254 RepID=A0A0E3ZKK2_9BURK|nr:EamA family transporter [Polynucleobacter duraquae]AKD24670.1 EamA-like transporter family [Polynucleobacter duraquae]